MRNKKKAGKNKFGFVPQKHQTGIEPASPDWESSVLTIVLLVRAASSIRSNITDFYENCKHFFIILQMPPERFELSRDIIPPGSEPGASANSTMTA